MCIETEEYFYKHMYRKINNNYNAGAFNKSQK